MPRISNRVLLLSLRFSSIAMLAVLIVKMSLLANPDIFSFWKALAIFGQLRDLIAYGIYLGLYYIYFGIVMLVGLIFSMTPGFNYSYYLYFSVTSFINIIGRWFYLPGTTTPAPQVGEVASLLLSTLRTMGLDFFMVTIRIMVGAMFFFAIRGSLTSKPEDSIKTVAFLNGILMLPMFFEQLDRVFRLLGRSSPQWMQEHILDLNILNDSIYEDISESFTSLVTSDIFLIAVLSFIYLEMVFQVAYVDKVITPTQEREVRLKAQIERMHKDAEDALRRLKAMQEEMARARMEKLSVEEMQKEMEERKRLSLRAFMSEKSEGAGYSFIEQLIEKKKAEREQEKRMRAMQDTQRVAHYLDKLFKQDPEAESTLTAQSAAPKASRLVYTTIRNILLRFFSITFLVYICIRPYYTFTTIFRAPPSIANSVELQTIEAVLSIFIPILLVIPLASTIIKVTKQTKLEEQLREEEIKRLGITEEEYERLKKQKKGGGEITEEEVKLMRDQDAMAAEQEASS